MVVMLLIGPAQLSPRFHGNGQARTPFAVTIERIAEDRSGEVSMLCIYIFGQSSDPRAYFVSLSAHLYTYSSTCIYRLI